MKQIPIWVVFISVVLLFHATNAVEEIVKSSLINFLATLNGTNGQPDPSFGWNNATDPCQGGWKGVICDSRTKSSVKRIYLNQSSLSGVFDAAAICNVPPLASSLVHIKLDQNNIGGQLPTEIVNCKNLTRLLIGQNKFSGNLPDSLRMLINLQRLDISRNSFSGNVPNLSRISGLSTFLAEYNKLTGEIPNFDLTNFEMFNVSFNDFTGATPVKTGRFDESSFIGNPGLCGPVLNKVCSFLSDDNKTKDEKESNGVSKDDILMYSGYGLVGIFIFGLIIYKLSKRNEKKEDGDQVNKVSSIDDAAHKPSDVSTSYKIEASRSAENSATVSSSLIILTSPVVNGFNFENLLRAPAELIEKGKHGSLYRVVCENGLILAVKRIKDWAISINEFKQRMQNIYQANHPNVLSPLAFYCSKQEKLLVYEYQQYGSLHKFLHGSQTSQAFEWISRLNVAARIAEALAFMHQKLRGDGIAHGNLKSSNILFNKNMEPCISEYGLMVVDNNQDSSSSSSLFINADAFKGDVYGFGVILLELLTGKLVQTNGTDLTTWVHSVVREEWTVEVFDKILISEGASEERMVNLLQVAIKCVNPSTENRPAMNQVALMINTIKEEEDKSVTFEA